MIMKLGMENYVLKLYKVYINDEPELTLTYFMRMSNFANQISHEHLQDHWSSGFKTLVTILWLEIGHCCFKTDYPIAFCEMIFFCISCI